MPKVVTNKNVEVEAYNYGMLASYFIGGVCYAGTEDVIFEFFFSIKFKSDTGLDYHTITFVDHNREPQELIPDEFVIIHEGKIWKLTKEEFKAKIKPSSNIGGR